MTQFKLTDELLDEVKLHIDNEDNDQLEILMNEFHYADVAEIANELSIDEATYLIKLLDSEKTSDAIAELDEDVREGVLKNLSAKEIADELEELDSDDAADIVNELPEELIEEVISK